MIDLERFLKERKIKKSELAAQLGISNASITKAVQNTIAIPQSWIDKINRIYKVDLSQYKIKELPIVDKSDNGKPIAMFENIEVYGTANPVLTDHITMKPSAFVTIPMFSACEAAVQVKGHSMKGYINHGDWIVIKKINNKDAIIYGEPYLVVTKSDNLKTVKFVKKGKDRNTLLLCPYNTDQFDDQEIEKEEVHEMYSVVGLFRSL